MDAQHMIEDIGAPGRAAELTPDELDALDTRPQC